MKTILWDFYGVILESMKVRDWGFRKIFKNFDDKKVEELLAFHNLNGGLSRYLKIRYFYEHILRRDITKEEVLENNNFKFLMVMSILKSINKLTQENQLIFDEFENHFTGNLLTITKTIYFGLDFTSIHNKIEL